MFLNLSEAAKDVGEAALERRLADGKNLYTAVELFRKMVGMSMAEIDDCRAERGEKD
jgi:hypothetical protein